MTRISSLKDYVKFARYVLILLIVFSSGAPSEVLAKQSVQSPVQNLSSTAGPQQDSKDLEILKLKQEIDRLKMELNSDKKISPSSEPPSIRPSSMTEREFIESHRAYQDNQSSIEGNKNIYPGSLILRYKKLMSEYPRERTYSYLYARIAPFSEKSELIQGIVSKYPDFPYGHRLKWNFLLHEKNPPDCKSALISAEREKVLDPELEMNDIFTFLNQCVTAQEDAPKIILTFDNKSIKEDADSYTAFSKNADNSITLKKKLFKSVTNTNIRLKYVGITRKSAGPELHYKITETGDYIYLKLLFVPKTGKQIINKTRNVNTTEFLTGNGAADLFIGVEDMVSLKEIQIEE